MVYCDTCAAKKTWPKRIAQVKGVCEICGETRKCNTATKDMLPEENEASRQQVFNLYL